MSDAANAESGFRVRLEEISWPHEVALRESEVLLEVLPARVSMLSRGRNAWRSTWVRHYQGPTAMFSTVESAKSAAEPLRGPGNVFYIAEAPALVLRGIRLSCVLVDFHADNSFGKYMGASVRAGQGRLRPGMLLRQAVAGFNHQSGNWVGPLPSKHSLRTGQVRDVRNSEALAGRRLLARSSFAQGVNYRLGWDLQPTRFSRRGVNAVVKAFAALATEIPGYEDLLQSARSIEAAQPDRTDFKEYLRLREEPVAARTKVAELVAHADDTYSRSSHEGAK